MAAREQAGNGSVVERLDTRDDPGPVARGPILPRLDATRLERHLPSAQRIRIEINGCLCGAPVAIPDAVTELAVGWALANRFFRDRSELGKVSASASLASLMIESGVDLDRARYEAIGWIPRQDLEGDQSTERSDRAPRAVAVMSEMDALATIRRAVRRFEEDGSRVGYVHAGLATADDVVCIARDLYLHPTVYKVVGWALTSGIDCANSLLVVRGVIDETVIEVAARAGIPIVATEAVPTAAAVKTATSLCVTVVGLATSHRRALFVDGGHLADDTLPPAGETSLLAPSEDWTDKSKP